MAGTAPGGPRAALLAVAAALLVLVAAVLHAAWVTDDAYITFRTIENLFAGHGLRWNRLERVQAFTHPLWMMLMTAARATSGEFFHSSITVSTLLTLGAATVLALRVATSPVVGALLLVTLALSRSFVHYSTSGLENALTHALLALFVWRLLAARSGFGTLCLLGAGLMLTRLDLGLLILPSLAARAATVGGVGVLRGAAFGFAPLVVWELFALVYYGSLLPNSALAKLNHGLPLGERVAQGLVYFGQAWRWDPVTVVAVAGGPVLALVRTARSPRSVARQEPWLALGVVLFLAYLLSVGGGFMAGRFLTPPFFLGMLLAARQPLPGRVAWPMAALASLLLVTPFLSPFIDRYPGDARAPIPAHGITDEHEFYPNAWLRHSFGEPLWPEPKLARTAEIVAADWRRDPFSRGEAPLVLEDPAEWSAVVRAGPGVPVVIRGAIGFVGFYLGPSIHVVDYNALADPLLARLPMTRPDPVLAHYLPHAAAKGWRAGHFFRALPAGYLSSLHSGENRIEDPALRAFYERVRLVSRGPLFSAERLAAIWELESGRLDSLVDAYLARRGAR